MSAPSIVAEPGPAPTSLPLPISAASDVTVGSVTAIVSTATTVNADAIVCAGRAGPCPPTPRNIMHSTRHPAPGPPRGETSRTLAITGNTMITILGPTVPWNP